MDKAIAWRELGARFERLDADARNQFDAQWIASGPVTQDGQWVITGAPADADLRSFGAAAEHGAALLGCSGHELNSDYWLDALKRDGTDYQSELGFGSPTPNGDPGDYVKNGRVVRVCLASAHFCERCQNRAIIEPKLTPAVDSEKASMEPPTPEPTPRSPFTADTVRVSRPEPNRTSDQPQEARHSEMKTGEKEEEHQGKTIEVFFPKRAAWLERCLKERSWDKNDLKRESGVDRKTIQKILDGKKVRREVLGRICEGLSTVKRLPPVNPVDVPDE